MNNLSNLFKIYFTILSQKIGDNNKLPDLQALLPNFEDEKRCIKRITKANLTQLQSITSDNTLLRDGFSLHGRNCQSYYRQSLAT